MESWKPQGPTCKDCLNTLDEKSSFTNSGTMITPNGHGTPLKNPQNLTTGCNGNLLLKNGHPKTQIIKSNINSKNGHLEKTNHLDLVKESLCCLRCSQSSLKKQTNDDEDYEDDENSCGIFSYRPRWMQPLANKKVFLAVFCLTSVLQGMYYTYFVSVLTTIEKLYQIQSKTTGLIMSATEIGQIGGALLLTYYGGQGHRPKWIACGMLVFAVASIFCATPHFMFSELTETSASAENSTMIILRELKTKLCHNKLSADNTSFSSTVFPSDFPDDDDSFLESLVGYDSRLKYNRSLRAAYPELFSENASFASLPPVAQAWIRSNDRCENKQEQSVHSKVYSTVLLIFFICLLFIGIGATAVYTLGIPYIDDNVATRESPLYFGITIGVRIFGPVFGFLLGSACTGIYVRWPYETTELRTDNPQWLGAWWLGVLIVGACLILTSIPMMMFPRELRRSCKHDNRKKFKQSISQGELLKCNGNVNGTATECQNCQLCPQAAYYAPRNEDMVKPSLRDFPSAMKRLLRNEILLLRTASSVLHILPIAGLYTFLPKYLESQFRLTASMSNMISGMAGILVMGIGIFASGTYMRRYKPNARFVAKWIAICALLYSIGMMILMTFGCPLTPYVGLNVKSEYEVTTQRNCNSTCNCNTGIFSPICTSEGVTYLSPCLAGCTGVEPINAEFQYIYSDCQCLGPNVTAVNGYCPLNCSNLFPYIIVFASFVLIHSTSEVGSMLLTLRCVAPKDKAMALGLIAFAIGLFGNVPCPIIYGAVVDSACLFWEDNCGELGACRLYDPAKFRKVFHGVTAIIMLMAFFVDCIVWYKAKDIKFQDDEPGDEEETVPFNEAIIPQRESSV